MNNDFSSNSSSDLNQEEEDDEDDIHCKHIIVHNTIEKQQSFATNSNAQEKAYEEEKYFLDDIKNSERYMTNQSNMQSHKLIKKVTSDQSLFMNPSTKNNNHNNNHHIYGSGKKSIQKSFSDDPAYLLIKQHYYQYQQLQSNSNFLSNYDKNSLINSLVQYHLTLQHNKTLKQILQLYKKSSLKKSQSQSSQSSSSSSSSQSSSDERKIKKSKIKIKRVHKKSEEFNEDEEQQDKINPQDVQFIPVKQQIRNNNNSNNNSSEEETKENHNTILKIQQQINKYNSNNKSCSSSSSSEEEQQTDANRQNYIQKKKTKQKQRLQHCNQIILTNEDENSLQNNNNQNKPKHLIEINNIEERSPHKKSNKNKGYFNNKREAIAKSASEYSLVGFEQQMRSKQKFFQVFDQVMSKYDSHSQQQSTFENQKSVKKLKKNSEQV